MVYTLLFSLLFCTCFGVAQSTEQTPLTSGEVQLNECDVVCSSLAQIFGDETYVHASSEDFTSSFFAQQQQKTTPKCVILPESSNQVSLALQVLRERDCHFAIRSGGHGMFSGASNAPGGVTVDLRHLDSIAVSEDHLSTFVGTARKWGDVYSVLEPLNLTVVGARDSQIGVGGFVLGGGISFVSRRHGWGCDNVRKYEVVLSNGSITDVSYESHPDLFFALRGGGNQFGIVTKFELDTYPQTSVWGGHSFYLLDDVRARKQTLNLHEEFKWTIRSFTENISSWAVRFACRIGYCSSVETLLREFKDFSESSDPFGQIILSFAAVPYGVNTWIACLNRLYGKPEADSAIFKGFATQNSKSVYSTARITPLSGINAEVDGMNVAGFRQSWSAATFKISIRFMSELVNIYIAESHPISYVPGIIPSLILQVITREEIAAFRKNGGNAFGITEEDGPLLLINSAFQWNNAEDDDAVQEANKRIMDRAVKLGKEEGVHHRYIYQNYANQTQDVFAGYSDESRKRLVEVQKKYDPEGVFSRLQPGYFRL